MKLFHPDAVHVMLDTETLGNKPTAAIVQLGAVKFSIARGIIDQFLVNIDPKDSVIYGDMDASTVLWWIRQNKEAQNSVFNENLERTSLAQALGMFTAFVKNNSTQKSRTYIGSDQASESLPPVTQVWAHASFDFPVLRHAMDAFNYVLPWDYWQVRDLRTLEEIGGITRPSRDKSVHHNALDDAKWQAEFAISIMAHINQHNKAMELVNNGV